MQNYEVSYYGVMLAIALAQLFWGVKDGRKAP